MGGSLAPAKEKGDKNHLIILNSRISGQLPKAFRVGTDEKLSPWYGVKKKTLNILLPNNTRTLVLLYVRPPRHP